MCGQVQEVLWNIVGGFRVIVGVIHVQTILLRWGENFTDNGGPTLFRLVFFTSIKS